ncbi:MAG: winged helix-turn-helix domain-containing protein [Candidatus Bathyarchaeales archaeon]
MAKDKSKFSYKIWLEYEGKPLIGKGGAQILEKIEKEKSISKAAEKLGMSYRYVWSYLKRIEKTLGEPVVETFRGGKMGGGGAKLTRLGESLLKEYKHVENRLSKALASVNRTEE